MSLTIRRILVPVDVDVTADRPLAERLVDDTCALAKTTGAELTLLYVAVPTVTPFAPPLDPVSQAYRVMLDVVEARNAAANRALDELVERARERGVQAKPVSVSREGSVPSIVVDVAAEERADLIVLTTHGRRGVARLVLGSVAERTAHLSPIPVLLLPPSAANPSS